MKFGIGIEIDHQADSKFIIVQKFSDDLEKFISNLELGSGIEHFSIGLICVLTKPGYEEWYKERKPRFQKESKVKDLTGGIMLFKNLFSYDIKLDNDLYHEFVNGTDNESEKLLARVFVDSLHNFEKLPKHVTSFDKTMFIESVKNNLIDKG